MVHLAGIVSDSHSCQTHPLIVDISGGQIFHQKLPDTGKDQKENQEIWRYEALSIPCMGAQGSQGSGSPWGRDHLGSTAVPAELEVQGATREASMVTWSVKHHILH